ncbi:MAG TPA: DnaB-like helicase C-terminal domain-containing protein [Ktedonobacteraceae bacterium]|jgi:KaiC/GvpD/RAD55 family RecA-like ATPase
MNDSNAVPTGFSGLDQLLEGGLPRGVLTILTSPFTAEGKTSLATTILHHASRLEEIQSLLFSLAGSYQTVLTRLFALETGLDTREINDGQMTGKDLAHLNAYDQNTKRQKLWIVDEVVKSVDAIGQHMTTVSGSTGLDLMQAWDAAAYARILRDLHLLARDSHAAILVIAHTIKTYLPQELMLSAARTVLVLNRDEQYVIAHLEVRQRGRRTRAVPLDFYPPTTRFFEDAAPGCNSEIRVGDHDPGRIGSRSLVPTVFWLPHALSYGVCDPSNAWLPLMR